MAKKVINKIWYIDVSGGETPPPTPTDYTIRVKVDPNSAGTAKVTSGTKNNSSSTTNYSGITISEGSTYSLTQTTNANYTFTKWHDDTDNTDVTNVTNLTATKNKDYTAQYTESLLPGKVTLAWKINEGISGITITSPNLGFKTSDGSIEVDEGTTATWETTAKDGYAAEVGSGWTRRTASSVLIEDNSTIAPTALEAYTGSIRVTWTGNYAGDGFKEFSAKNVNITTDGSAMDVFFKQFESSDDFSFVYYNDIYKTFKGKSIIFDIEGIFPSGYYDKSYGFAAIEITPIKNSYVKLKDYSGFSIKKIDQTIGTGGAPVGTICDVQNNVGELYTDMYWRVRLEIVPTDNNFECMIQTYTRDNAT